MEHFLSKKKDRSEEIVELDVSFILKYLNKLTGIPVELMIIKLYHLRAKGGNNTAKLFKIYLKDKLKINNDTELYKIVSRNRYTKTVLKIKSIIDGLIYEKYGCEILDCNFVSYKTATNKSVIINVVLHR